MERFIVGTGRCGSTLLSRMIAEHPGVLSLFEFFNGLDFGTRFQAGPMSGGRFAELISAEQPFLSAVLRRGYPVEEVIYPFHDQGGSGRYSRSDSMPWALVTTLARLSDDPDALFDALVDFAATLSDQPPAAHYLAIFNWLRERLGRECWVERSGSSIDYLGDLTQQFPQARILHIHRDGPEVALSMREHHAYRLPISLMYDAPLDGGVKLADLPPIDIGAEPADDDTVSRILRSRPPAEYFGRYWTDQVIRGFGVLGRIDADQYAEVRFEDLVREPHAELARIAEFFALSPDRGDWLERAAKKVRGVPPTRFQNLDSKEQSALREACEPGRKLLQREPL